MAKSDILVEVKHKLLVNNIAIKQKKANRRRKALSSFLPSFPDFRRIELTDKQNYESWYKDFHPYSDFSFNNLWVWLNLNDDLHLSSCGDTVIYRYTNPFSDRTESYTLLGERDVLRAARLIFDTQKANGQAQRLVMVPQEAANILREYFDAKEEPDNFDYIFSSRDWYYMKNGFSRHLRGKVNKVIKDHSEHMVIKELDLTSEHNKSIVVNGIHKWHALNALTNNDKLGLEGLAINRCLLAADELDVKCLIITIEGKVSAVCLYHFPPQEGYVIFNHLKCNYNIPGIFDFTFHSALSKLYPRGYRYFNAEQDLGISGLRTHKTLMHPIEFLKRYEITQ